MRRGAEGEAAKGLTGEMMLAKSVLEEKNALLEEKDRRIRECVSRERHLSEELAAVKGQLERQGGGGEDAVRQAVEAVVEEVALLAVEHLPRGSAEGPELAVRLLELLERRYGLERIDGAEGGLDPRVHRVIEAGRGGEGEESVEVLAAGLRLGGRVIRAALVRVVGRGVVASPAGRGEPAAGG